MRIQERGLPTIFIDPLLQLATLLLLFVALLQRIEGLVYLALLILGIVNGAKIWSKASLIKVNSGMSLDKEKTFPGDKIILEVYLENAKLLPVWLSLYLPMSQDGVITSTKEVTEGTGLLWYQKVNWQWEFIAKKRGLHTLGPPTLEAGDLLGFFKQSKELSGTLTILVYPRLLTIRQLPLPLDDVYGVKKARQPIVDRVNLIGTRDYQWGSTSKNIHWKASARHNKLQEKIFEATLNLKVFLILDVKGFSKEKSLADFEKSLEVIASIACRLEAQGVPIGLVVNGGITGGGSPILPISKGEQQLPAILEVLARLETSAQDSIENVLNDVQIHKGTTCIFFSRQIDQDLINFNEYLEYRAKTKNLFIASQISVNLEEFSDRAYLLKDICGEEDIHD